MSSSTDSSFWKEQARETRPGNASRSSPMSSSGAMLSHSRSGSCGLATDQHLLQGVAAQPEAQRLQRDDLVGRDVAEVDLGAERLDEPGLARLCRRLEDDVVDADTLGDRLEQVG